MKFLNNINLFQNELQNARLQNLASAPGTPVVGQIYHDTALVASYIWNGTAWRPLDAAKLTDGSIANTALTTNPLARANHTGTQEASTISDLATVVKAYRIDEFANPTADRSMNGYKITSVADPVNAQDAATKNYVDNVAIGLDVKASVRLATTATVGTYSSTGGSSGRGQLTACPSTLDSVGLVASDRILVKDHSTPAANGIYVVTSVGTGADGVWNRATDFDADADVSAGAFAYVEEGTVNADSGWTLTTNNPIIVGGASGTSLAFAQFSGAGQITAGAGLTKSGNTLDVVGTASRIVVNADSIDIHASYVGQTSITTLGTITTGTWNAGIIAGTYGGTGVNNSTRTITIAGNFVTAGAFALTLTTTATTNVTLPTTGTLSTLAGAETITGKVSYNGLVITANTGAITTGSWTATVIAGQYGGTGVANTGKTITLGGNLTTSGAYAVTFTLTAATTVTLPVSGTLVSSVTTGNGVSASNTAGALAFTLGVITPTSVNGLTFVAAATGFTIAGGTSSKTLTQLKTMSFNAADDTGVYTFPTGTKTLVATDVTTLSSLVSIGTITTGTWTASVIAGQYGGTGVANTGKTITLGGNLTTSGAYAVTFTLTAATTVTLPTTGTLATLAGAETITAKLSYNGMVITANTGVVTTGTWNGTAVAVGYGGTGAANVAEAKTNLGFMTRYSVTVGGATSVTVTHNLGTRDVVVMVYLTASTYDVVQCDVQITTTNTVTLIFATAPAAGEYTCVVIG